MEKKRNGFFIQNKFFSIPAGGLGENFIVKSVPYNYQVLLLSESNPMLEVNRQFLDQPGNILLIDKNVYKLYRKFLKVPANQIFQAQADENFKTLEGATKLIDFLQARKFSKSGKLVVVGGGVVQDTAALVGALFKRGIVWYFFPTTLLAMCDSCIGAKASINYKGVKNQLGVFSAPQKVYINSAFLKTLDNRQKMSGLGEIFKLCVSGGQKAYENYCTLTVSGSETQLQNYKKLIKLALSIKKAVIEIDEFDNSYRKSLNYGHSFGHALEGVTGYQVPHGQAVAAGMLIVNELSVKHDLLGQEQNHQLQKQAWKLLDAKSIKAIKKVNVKQLFEVLKLDKKVAGGRINLVLLKTIGHLVFYPVKTDKYFLAQVSSIIKELFQTI